MTLPNEELIEKARSIFADSLDKHIPNIPELAKWWSRYDAFENWEGKTLPQLILESKRTEDDLRVVAEEATICYNNWLLENEIHTPYNAIDGKGRLYAPFSAIVETVLETYKITIVHPATDKEIVYNYNVPCVSIDSYELNRSPKTPEDIVFYGSTDTQITGKAFALLT